MATCLPLRQRRSWLQQLADAGGEPASCLTSQRNLLQAHVAPGTVCFFPESPPPYDPARDPACQGELCPECCQLTPHPRLAGPLVVTCDGYTAFGRAERARPSNVGYHFYKEAPYQGRWLLCPLTEDESQRLEREGWHIRALPLLGRGHLSPTSEPGAR